MNTSNIRLGSLMACLLATTLLQGCASTPMQNAQLDQARNDYAAAGNDQRVVQAAPEQLRQASADLSQASVLQKDGAPQSDVDHYAHLAILQVMTARQLAAADASQAYVKQAGDRRNQMMLQASQQQTQQAQLQANAADARASDADAKTMQAQQQNQQMQVDAANAKVAESDAQATQTQQQNTALLAALDAKQTDRGMVLTLGSVLFESNDADLNASGERSLDKLAQFLHDNPKRNVRVEGYTDSTGDASYNQDLSKRRADAVSSALADDGVDSQRTESKGFGEEFAVASNRTASGRQQNRRVEIVISSADGSFPATR
jgi:outer membrane protein OmpA-like peptidoglycan-associated protein